MLKKFFENEFHSSERYKQWPIEKLDDRPKLGTLFKKFRKFSEIRQVSRKFSKFGPSSDLQEIFRKRFASEGERQRRIVEDEHGKMNRFVK